MLKQPITNLSELSSPQVKQPSTTTHDGSGMTYQESNHSSSDGGVIHNSDSDEGSVVVTGTGQRIDDLDFEPDGDIQDIIDVGFSNVIPDEDKVRKSRSGKSSLHNQVRGLLSDDSYSETDEDDDLVIGSKIDGLYLTREELAETLEEDLVQMCKVLGVTYKWKTSGVHYKKGTIEKNLFAKMEKDKKSHQSFIHFSYGLRSLPYEQLKQAPI